MLTILYDFWLSIQLGDSMGCKENQIQKILLKTNCSADDILIRHRTHSSRVISEDFKNRLEESWIEYCQQAEKKGKRVWNSHLYRFEDIESLNGSVALEVSTIETKEVLIFRELAKRHTFDESEWPKNMFVASLLMTADEKYLFAIPSGLTVGSRSVDLLGGALSRNEAVIKNGRDILEALYREFKEEFNVDKRFVAQSQFRGVVQTNYFNIGLIFLTTLSIDGKEAQRLFREKNDGELESLLAIEGTEVKNFLARSGSYLPLTNELIWP
jgi:hypothetical protein